MSAQASHLSDWSFLRGAQLQPAAATVEANGTVSLTIVTCELVEVDLLTSLLAHCSPTPGRIEWAVNSVAGGSKSWGKITATGIGTAAYSAPATPSASQPVAVSAIGFVPLLKGSGTLVSNLTILPGSGLAADQVLRVPGADPMQCGR